MKSLYRNIERGFEKLTSFLIRIYGNSLTFIIALGLVIFFLLNKKFYEQDLHDAIKDIILSITFLSFFIIQKSVNRFSIALHLKINELVAAHDKASNRMINVEEKTEEELTELARHYSDLAEQVRSSETMQSSHSIEHVLSAENNNSDGSVNEP